MDVDLDTDNFDPWIFKNTEVSFVNIDQLCETR